MTTLLKVQDLTKTFAKGTALPPVLSDVSFSVEAGEIWAIVGRSGSGKSTLLRILSGLERPTSGVIEWAAGAKSELVNSESGLREGKLAHWGLKPLFGHGSAPNLATLPRGELHRLRIEQALTRKAEVLLLDEPYWAMDPAARMRVRTWLREFTQSRKRAVVIATQSLEEALRLGARTLLLDRGEIHQCDEASGIYRDPGTRAAARASGFNFLEGRLTQDSRDGSPVFAFADGETEGTLPLRFLHSAPVVPGAEPGRGSLVLGARPEAIRVARTPEQFGEPGVLDAAEPPSDLMPGWEAPWIGAAAWKVQATEGQALRWSARVARVDDLGREARLIAEVGTGLWEISVPRDCDLRAGERCWLELDREAVCWFDAQGARLRLPGDGEAVEPLSALALEDEAGTRGLKITARNAGAAAGASEDRSQVKPAERERSAE